MREGSVDTEGVPVAPWEPVTDLNDRDLNEVRSSGKASQAANIPETIVRKLARIAGLAYAESHRSGGGGLCMGITGVRQRRKALAILGQMVGQIGKESMNTAVEVVGATWLDVVGWREDAEYAALWAAGVKVRREVAAARLEDELWDRSLNGALVEEAKKDGKGVISVAEVRKFDNGLGVQLLKGLGFVGKDGGVRSAKGLKGVAEKPVPGVDGAPVEAEGPGENVDTVLFADRKTAFAAMGRPQTADGGKS